MIPNLSIPEAPNVASILQGLSWWGRVGRGVGRLQGGGVWRGVLQEEGDC